MTSKREQFCKRRIAELEKQVAAYRYAIEQKYRFYSYGDAMLIV